MKRVGYACVSISEESADAQVVRLQQCGCATVYEEEISGAKASRPMLDKAIQSLKSDDKLVVIKCECVARSLGDLIAVLERIEDSGAFFESLSDNIDCSTFSGKFFLQILSSVAECKKSLVQERTVSGLNRACEQGRIGGNPGLRSRDPGTIEQLNEARKRAYLDKLLKVAEYWVPIVAKCRPSMSWEDVVLVVNVSLRRDSNQLWTYKKLLRAAKCFVGEGKLDSGVLKRSQTRSDEEAALMVISSIINHMPFLRPEELVHELEMVDFPVRFSWDQWDTSSIKHYIRRARDLGFIHDY